MRIFRLVQETWNDREVGDFNLPRIVGYYTTSDKAEERMNQMIAERRGFSDEDGYLTLDDFRIQPVIVQ